MDLSNMEAKLETDEYATPEDFVKDVNSCCIIAVCTTTKKRHMSDALTRLRNNYVLIITT